MNLPLLKITQASLKTEWVQSLFLLVLVLLFALNSLGLLDFNLDSFPGFNLNPELLFPPSGGFRLPRDIASTEFLFMSISGICLSLALPILKPIPASLIVLALTLPPFAIAAASPVPASQIPMQYTLLVLLVLFGLNVLMQYFAITRKKQHLVDIFGRYVPPEIVEEMHMQDKPVDLEGESKPMTVMFCDMENFSGVSEIMSPRDLVKLLNEYFNVLTEVLYRYGATIDKYIGDSVMTFWSAPVTQEDHAQRAVLASFDMQEAIAKLSQSYVKKGWPPLAMGIGINTGIMNVGNMGSRYRLAYTVVGDAVNTSSRFQEMTRIYHIPTICGEETVKSVKGITFMELDTILVKGRHMISKIYHPLGPESTLSDATRKAMEQHHAALESYYNEKFAEAEEIFQSLIATLPEFEAYYRYMIYKLSRQKSINMGV